MVCFDKLSTGLSSPTYKVPELAEGLKKFKSASGLIARGACCWSVDVLFFLFLILDFFKAKSPTFVGLFMDKKSMLRNGVENFRRCGATS